MLVQITLKALMQQLLQPLPLVLPHYMCSTTTVVWLECRTHACNTPDIDSCPTLGILPRRHIPRHPGPRSHATHTWHSHVTSQEREVTSSTKRTKGSGMSVSDSEFLILELFYKSRYINIIELSSLSFKWINQLNLFNYHLAQWKLIIKSHYCYHSKS